MLKSRFGYDIDAIVKRVFPFLFLRPIDPNWLSVLGAAVSLGGALAFAAGEFRWAALIVLAGGFFDLVDGVVARHNGVSTSFGGFLDSTLDRVVDVGLLLGLVIFYARTGEPTWAWTAGVALIASVTVSYSKARAEAVIDELNVGMLERAERIVILAAGALFGWMPLALGVIAVGSLITVGQRVALAHRLLSEHDAAAPVAGQPGGTHGG